MSEQWTKERVEEILKIARMCEVISLDTPVKINGDEFEGENCIGDFIESEEPSPQEQVEKKCIEEKLDKDVANSLNEKELFVIKHRFGFNGKPKTLQWIADRMTPALTRERVRQIEERAIRKLRRKLKESDYRG